MNNSSLAIHGYPNLNDKESGRKTWYVGAKTMVPS